MNPLPLIAAFAYGRVSSRANGVGVSRQEQSIEVQDTNLRSYIAEAGIPLGAFTRDDGTERFFAERGSGAFKKQDIRTRPEGRKMWDEIIQTRRDYPAAQIHFLLTKVDRIGRGFLATQNMFAELRQLRVKVHIINLGGKSFDTDSLMGQKIIADMAWVSEVEVASCRERIMDTLTAKQERGEVCGHPCFGWDAVPTGRFTAKGVEIRELRPNPVEQKWLTGIIERAQRGETAYSIAQWLAHHGVPTKRAGEVRRVKGQTLIVRNRWTPQKIEKILSSKTVQAWLDQSAQTATLALND